MESLFTVNKLLLTAIVITLIVWQVWKDRPQDRYRQVMADIVRKYDNAIEALQNDPSNEAAE